MYRVEVCLKQDQPDARGAALVKDIHDLGIASVSEARVVDVYWFDGELTAADLERVCRQGLADPVTQEYRHFTFADGRARTGQPASADEHIVEVAFNPGVTEPLEDTVLKAVRDLGMGGVGAVKTARQYVLRGRLTEAEMQSISSRLLVNPIIQQVVREGQFVFPQNPQYTFKLMRPPLPRGDKAAIAAMQRQFGFNDTEMQAVLAHFAELGREPTDAELETLAQTWSVHCVHKTFKARISMAGRTINNLLKSTVMKATDELNKPWCLSVFADNAGVIDFDGRWALCFKVETHNHPSAVEPYGGAATGIGGVIRDVLGTGLGARPILNTDVFCFGPPDFSYEKLPAGALHPRRVFKGVRAGVADYANRMGIATPNGAIMFDDGYVGNPLVFCGTLGLMPVETALKGMQQPGDLIVLLGGRTGRDGIHGVTFASEKLTEKSGVISYSSVQIGNPIVEKKVTDVLLQARDRRLFRRVTDCGGGGLSSAIGEMGEETGCKVHLERVPLKYAGLSYTEIWISESQERMILAVPPEHGHELLALCAAEDVEAVVVGEFTNDHKLQLFYKGNLVCDLEMAFLHGGRPQMQREAVWAPTPHPEPEFISPADLAPALHQVLGSWNVCSKEWVIRQYDHEVQGGSVLKPLVGKNNDGPGDATIIRPVLDSKMGAIVASGINAEYGKIDPYWMAASVIDEALRQVIAVGGNLEKVALLDNFCWGNTDKPEVLGALVRAADACHDMALAYGVPFISGKDSLYNEFQYEGKAISIPHTLLISAVGVMPDAEKAVSMDFKRAGGSIYIVGSTFNETGGSAYFKVNGFTGNRVPKVNAVVARQLMERLSQATSRGLVKACHDCSDGGLGVAVAEMAFAGGLGAGIDLNSVPLGEAFDREDAVLFSESNSRFVVEVAPENKGEFESLLEGVVFARIGRVIGGDQLEVVGFSGHRVIAASLSSLKEAWQKPLRW